YKHRFRRGRRQTRGRDGVCYNGVFHQHVTARNKHRPINLKNKGKSLYLELQQQLTQRVQALLKRQYDLDLPRLVVDQPPNVGLGEYALPLSFELAKKLRKPPRKIAEEIVPGLGQVPGFDN